MQRRHFLTAAASAATAVLGVGCTPTSGPLKGGFAGVNMERGHALRDLGKSGSFPAPSVQRRTRVLIAGAGMAGLGAARALRLADGPDEVHLGVVARALLAPYRDAAAARTTAEESR